MIIDCLYCESKVDAKLVAKKAYSGDDFRDAGVYYFLECPACGEVILAQADVVQVAADTWDYDKPTRLWPSNDESRLHQSIPALVRKSLEEARKCYRVKAFGACAVMCGRAIEAICSEQKTKSKYLGGGLKELKEKGIIDGRLFQWGDALRERRNIGAHATEEDISGEDAKDVLDFALAICEYVFVLSERYADFQARSQKKKKKPNGPPVVEEEAF
jgi:hypothetical protein